MSLQVHYVDSRRPLRPAAKGPNTTEHVPKPQRRSNGRINRDAVTSDDRAAPTSRVTGVTRVAGVTRVTGVTGVSRVTRWGFV